ncbi:PAS domain-containing protein [Halorubrum sp. CBA1125]|uniref:PAS domain-containing protein n=1 Tax=Halorubrum sp. CBA1125 TaxID=2668072 RepID=UPI002AA2A23F|nr:PAS domain-containing protein [Halorubrum sp. CBA1125]
MTAEFPRLGLDETLDERALLADAGGVTVLHVEDDPAVAELVARFVEREREYFEVVTETDPHAGVERAREADVDCVVCDYEMPGMNGLAVLEAVREGDPELPFLLFTGTGSEEIASEAISAGVTDYLQKGVGTGQYEVLANRVEQAVARRRAERHVERGFHAIEAAHDGISLLNDDGEFVYVNAAFAGIVGYDRGELLGSHWELLYPAAERERVANVILPQARADEWAGETEYVREDGETVTVDHRLSFTREGTMVCTVSEIDDDAVREELSMKERTMDEAPIGIVVTDPSREDNPITYANDGFLELTGYARDEVLGRNCRFLQGEATHDAPVAELARAVTAEEPVTVELRNYRKDGELFWNRVTVTPLFDDDGTLEHFVGFQEDVTTRRELLSEFRGLGSVLSHDLRNPLQAAHGQLELALETGDIDHVERAMPSLDRLDEVIDDVTDVLQSGSIVDEREPLDVGSVVESVWWSLQGDAEVGSLEVRGSPTVRGDRDAVQRLFDNLLGNAVEHGEPPVTVHVGELEDGFYVADDGPGVPAANRERIFEQGFSTKENDVDAGLGLTSVRQIVLAHDWRIDVTDSEALGGARFEIRTRNR